jgi:hypothetical protein
MTTLNNNLKLTASAIAALVVTMLMSWTFVDATSLSRVQRHGDSGFLAAVSALVR